MSNCLNVRLFFQIYCIFNSKVLKLGSPKSIRFHFKKLKHFDSKTNLISLPSYYEYQKPDIVTQKNIILHVSNISKRIRKKKLNRSICNFLLAMSNLFGTLGGRYLTTQINIIDFHVLLS